MNLCTAFTFESYHRCMEKPMASPANTFALIGRSHSSEAFELLYQASLTARAERRALERARGRAPSRQWRGSGEPVTLPLRLPG